MKLGILGNGQLALMLGHAAKKLPVAAEVSTYGPEEGIAKVPHTLGAWSDESALMGWLSRQDVVTVEFENIDVSLFEREKQVMGATFHPRAEIVRIAQDRWKEKTLAKTLGIGVCDFRRVDDLEDLNHLPYPGILKTRTMGYDGKGQTRVSNLNEAQASVKSNMIFESLVPFVREFSVLVARSKAGELCTYDPIHNIHRNGILHESTPILEKTTATQKAIVAATRLAERMGYVGVLAVEFFELSNGDVLFNEMAPRVHNSGHWSIEGTECSQFENHLRAIMGLPLGDTGTHPHVRMFNLISEIPVFPKLDGVYVHDYGKTPQPNRKLGHVTVVAGNELDLEEKSQMIRQIIGTPT